jgi:CRP-like cAMP-binding protein
VDVSTPGLNRSHKQKTIARRRLGALAGLTPQDDKFLAGLKQRRLEANALIHAADQPSIILSGWCARIKDLGGGRRQIINLLLPGDCFGIHASPFAADTLPVVALTQATVLDAIPLQRLIRMRPPAHLRLIEACEKALMLDQACLLSQIVRLGHSTAYGRVGRLLLELHARLEVAGLVDDGTFELPISRSQLAETAGMSPVHLHRTLAQLRQEGLVQLQGRTATLPRLAALTARIGCHAFLDL